MLELTIKATEYFDESEGLFVTLDAVTLRFEHSILAISKWESIHKKPFLVRGEKTPEQLLSYFQCMRLDPGPLEDLYRLGEPQVKELREYMNSSATATTFTNREPTRGGGEQITSELIYYWLTAYQIPFECETWHINRLMALVKICSIKNAPKKKMRRSEILSRNRALNEQRRAQLGTTG